MMPKYKLIYSAILSVGLASFSLNYVTHLNISAQASELTTLVVTASSGASYKLAAGSTELARATIKTHTPWTEGVQEFSGVPLKTLLAAAGIDEKIARHSTVKARALNDYEVEIPGQDAYDYDVLVADQMNGSAMPVTEFGPFWIVYPRDGKPELQDSRFDHRWAWQLSELLIE